MKRGRPDANKGIITKFLDDHDAPYLDVSIFVGFGCDLVVKLDEIVFLEIKAEGKNKLTDSEERLQNWCREYGARYEIVHNKIETALLLGLPYSELMKEKRT